MLSPLHRLLASSDKTHSPSLSSLSLPFLPYLMWREPILKGNTKCTCTSSPPQLSHIKLILWLYNWNISIFLGRHQLHLVSGTCQLLILALQICQECLFLEIQYGVNVLHCLQVSTCQFTVRLVIDYLCICYVKKLWILKKFGGKIFLV